MKTSFNDLKSKLSAQDIDQLMSLLGKRCRAKKLNRLRSMLTYGTGAIGSFGIFGRLTKENGQWDYCAGQSYTDEIRTVRECILRAT